MKFFTGLLLESKDKEGKDWEVVIIESGHSKNGFYYPPEVLKKAEKIFENAKAFAFEFPDKLFKHTPDFLRKSIPEGFPKSIVGWYDNVRFGEFKDSDGQIKQGLLARFHISENAGWLRQFLKDAWEHGKSLLGFSIDAEGRTSPTTFGGKIIQKVEEIIRANSVDVVTHPAAGGQLLRLIAGGNQMEWLKKLLEFLAHEKPEAVEGIDPNNITPEQELSLIKTGMETNEKVFMGLFEAGQLVELVAKLAEIVKDKPQALEVIKQIQAVMAKYPKPYEYPKYGYPKAAKTSESEDKTKKVLDEMAKMKEDFAKQTCKSILESELKSSELPQPIQASLKKRYEGKIFETAELQESIKEQRDILATLSKSGEVNGLGDKTEILVEEVEKKQAALDKMLDSEAKLDDKVKSVSAFRGLKEAYVAFTGDREISGHMPSQRITEAMGTSDFAYALGTSMTRRLVKMYQVLPSTWKFIASTVPVDNFKTQEAIRWGGFGRLPVVAEKGTYSDLGGSSDERATYAPTKKGGLALITREMIKNDDLKMLLRIPKELARAAVETLEYYVWNPILSNAAIYDGTALATVAHANYATDALAYASMIAARTRVRKQWSRGSKQESGTALGTHSTTTLQDTTKAWTTNAYAGKYVRLLSGTGAGAISLIASNTADTLTFAAVPTAPADATAYEISVASATDPRIGLEPKYLFCSVDLKPTAEVLRNSDLIPGFANNDVNVLKNSFDILTPLFLADTNNWGLAADKNVIDIIEVGFVDGQELPELIIQDVPSVGEVFKNDQITYKVRHEYGLAVVDYRGIDLSVV